MLLRHLDRCAHHERGLLSNACARTAEGGRGGGREAAGRGGEELYARAQPTALRQGGPGRRCNRMDSSHHVTAAVIRAVDRSPDMNVLHHDRILLWFVPCRRAVGADKVCFAVLRLQLAPLRPGLDSGGDPIESRLEFKVTAE